VKEAQEILKKTQGTSEAGASGSVQESVASEAERSEAPLSAKVTQIPDPPINISPSSPPSTDSDQDTIPLSQKYNLPKPTPKPKPTSTNPNQTQIRFNPTISSTGLAEVIMGSTIKKVQKVQSSATAEAPEEPSSSDQAHPGSPSNLFSLEKHLGGEIPITPQKANQSVPKQIDLVNQQPPKPSQQNNPEQTSLQTKTQAQTQKTTIPESVIETVVEESVLVTESKLSVSVSDFEPTQNLLLSASDQPSSSSHIQILEQPPFNILESESIEAELLKISEEMKALVQLRRVPTLSIDYEDLWASLKSKASELIYVVSKKCLRIQAAALKRQLRILHSSEQSTRSLLYLANAPFYPESDYDS